MSAENGPSSAEPVAYIAFRDRPVCPLCGLRDDVLSGGQWADGHCAWHCCACEHDWTTERTPARKGSNHE